MQSAATPYTRQRGAVAISIPLFFRLMTPRDVVERLKRSAFLWWVAQRVETADIGARTSSMNWRFSKLDSLMSPKLINELEAQTSDGTQQSVALVGTDPTIEPGAIVRELRAFDSGEPSLIQVVLVQVGDVDDELLFAQRPFRAEVQTLISDLGIPSTAFCEKPYKGLRVLRLSSMFQLDDK